jgi:hypothetical protein
MAGAQGTEQVLVEKIDDFVEQFKVNPDVIKIDTEGYELNIFKGMKQTLEKSASVIVSELSEKFLQELGLSLRETLRFMEGCGYHCYVLGDQGRLVGYPIGSAHDALPASPVNVVFTKGAPVFEVIECPSKERDSSPTSCG